MAVILGIPVIHASEITALAAFIAGSADCADPRLVPGLRKAVAGIAWARKAAAEHPTREELRAQLQTTLEAARFLQNRLTDTTFLRVLADASGDDPDAHRSVWQGLSQMVGPIEAALFAIPHGSNRHEYEPGTNSPKAACALSVAVAWRIARGDLPAHTSRVPQEACRRLWGMAGGTSTGWNDNMAGWKLHLARAKAGLKAGRHPEIERIFASPAR